ncbi:MAG: TonB-dependent receptor [Colwellia sp.]|nr:TonB-dependent receptor [Colwellia sp.]
MNNNNKLQFFKHSLLALSVVGALGSTASAQQENANAKSDEDGIERIMVTASKRLKGLQESPIAITVVSSLAVEQTKVLDVSDLQTLVPTLRVSPLQRSTNASFSIRGFANGANNIGIEPSVGVFIDGVYRSRAAAQIGDLPRLQQIEVLSGPQSTLFGKNASAGVINVRTLAPSHDLEGKVEFGVGNYNQQLMKAYITNGITDTLAVSLSGGYNARDGYTDSVSGLSELNDRDRWNIRGQALYEPTSDVTLRFIADYSEIDETCCTVSRAINGPTTGAVQFLGGTVLSDADPFAYQSALNIDPNNTVEDGGFSLQLDIDFDSFSFTSITALRNNESTWIHDIDYTSLDIIRETGDIKIDTFTQEFRLTSTGDNRFDWMVGAFIFQETVDSEDALFYGQDMRSYFDVLAAASLPGLLGQIEAIYGDAPGSYISADTVVTTEFEQENDAYSLFANFDYRLTDDFTATFGISYTQDDKDIWLKQQNNSTLSAIDLDNDLTLFGVPLPLTPYAPAIPALKGMQFMPPMLELPNSVENNESSDSQTTWSLRLAYELNDNINLFATAATGFKASSWNLSRDTRPFQADQQAIEAAGLAQKNQTYGGRYASPEDSTVYEIGMKARFEKGAINVTLFDQTIEGFQSAIFIGTGFILANAGKQSTQGIEFDSVYTPTDNWALTLAGTFLDPIYDSFEGASGIDGPIDLSGKKPAGIAEQTIVAGITYNFEFGNGMHGYLRTDYRYESEVHIIENVPESMTRTVSTFNASAGLSLENGVNLQLWARNLNNDEYFTSAFPTPIQGGSYTAYPSQPSTYGVSVSYEF